MNQNNQNHTLAAWTSEGDFVPTLYIQGEIATNDEKPIVTIREKHPQGIVTDNLLLEFDIDVYDPNGNNKLGVKNFEKKMHTLGDYTSVTIIAHKGDINLEVEGNKTIEILITQKSILYEPKHNISMLSSNFSTSLPK